MPPARVYPDGWCFWFASLRPSSTFYHMRLRLAWSWRLGPANSSERDHAKEILAQGEFLKNTLFCDDAGFIGYPIWSSIMC